MGRCFNEMVIKNFAENKRKIAFLFPGQGSQYTGMARDFYDRYPEARAVFDQAARILGPDIIDVIFSGPEDKLEQTEYAQPAILVASTAIYQVLAGLGFKASAFAGLSLGEYGALVAAGSLSFDDALPLVQKRGIYMQEAVPLGQGNMAAIMGLKHEDVEQVCREAQTSGIVSPANYNCPGQIVISGHKAAVKRAMELASSAGAKRITELKVSAPFHCALLEPVEEKMALELENIEIKTASVPLVSNVTADFVYTPEQIKKNLVVQVSNPILWEQSIRRMISSGINCFIGLGPGTSPGRLMKRIAPEVETHVVEKVSEVDQLLNN